MASIVRLGATPIAGLQQVGLLSGQHSAQRLLAAAHNGDVVNIATVTCTNGLTVSVPLALIGGAADSSRDGKTGTIAMDRRIGAGQGVDDPPTHSYGTALPLDVSRTLLSLTLPGRREIYAATMAA